MEKCVLKEIRTQNNTPFRLYIAVSRSSLEAILLQKENAWKSTVQKKSLGVLAKEHKLSLEDYCTKLLEYVKNGGSEVAFVFNNPEFAINRVLTGSLMVKFFTCAVEKVDYTKHVEQIMDQLYSDHLKSSERLHALRTENEQLLQNKTQCESKLNDLIEKKIAEENEQFGQFVMILNEKKRRILHLTELLEAFKNGRATTNPLVSSKSRKRAAPVKKVEVISESEDSENSTETIEDTSCKPSTSTDTFDFLEESFTQPHTVPKRVKIEKSEDVVVAAPPKSPPKTEPEVAVERKSADIDLSTQQLLDLL